MLCCYVFYQKLNQEKRTKTYVSKGNRISFTRIFRMGYRLKYKKRSDIFDDRHYDSYHARRYFSFVKQKNSKSYYNDVT